MERPAFSPHNLSNGGGADGHDKIGIALGFGFGDGCADKGVRFVWESSFDSRAAGNFHVPPELNKFFGIVWSKSDARFARVAFRNHK